MDGLLRPWRGPSLFKTFFSGHTSGMGIQPTGYQKTFWQFELNSQNKSGIANTD